MDKIDKLKKLLELSQNDTITPKEVEQFLTMVLGFIKKSKDEFESLSAENLKTIKDCVAYLEGKFTNTLDDKINTATGQMEANVSELKALIAKVKTIKPVDGIDGVNPDPEDVVPLVLAQLPKVEPFTVKRDEVVREINTGKKGDTKIELEQIEGVDKLEKGVLDRAVSILDSRTKFLINKNVKHDATMTGSGTDADPLSVVSSGVGAVSGPVSSTDNAIARYDGTTGQIIQNSAATVADTSGMIENTGGYFKNGGVTGMSFSGDNIRFNQDGAQYIEFRNANGISLGLNYGINWTDGTQAPGSTNDIGIVRGGASGLLKVTNGGPSGFGSIIADNVEAKNAFYFPDQSLLMYPTTAVSDTGNAYTFADATGSNLRQIKASSIYVQATTAGGKLAGINPDGSGTFTGDVTVPDEAYGPSWDGSLEVPTKNALYDKIETITAGAGITRTITTSSGAFTAGSSSATDYVYLIAGAHAVALPTAVGNTNRYTFKNNHSAAITITPDGAETVEGGATLSLNPLASVDLISNNSVWFVI